MIFGIVIVFEVYVFQVKRGLPKLFNEINIIQDFVQDFFLHGSQVH